MRKIFALVLILFLASGLQAQYRVRFIVHELTAISHDSIYITGTFNNWDSTARKDYRLLGHGDRQKSIVLTLPAGPIRYKFTRGNWLTVEKEFYGREVQDRILTIRSDTTIQDTVNGWRDQMIADKMTLLARNPADTIRLGLLSSIANNYAFFPEWFNPDSALFYAQSALQLYQKITASDDYNNWKQSGQITQLLSLQEILAALFHSLGNYPKSLEIRFDNLKLAEQGGNKLAIVQTIRNVANDYKAMKDYPNVLKYGKRIDSILGTTKLDNQDLQIEKTFANEMISRAFYDLGQLDSALAYATKPIQLTPVVDMRGYIAYNSWLQADIYYAFGKTRTAYIHYRTAIDNSLAARADIVTGNSLAGLAQVFKKEGRLDSALYFARLAMNFFQSYKSSIQAWGENSDSYIAEVSPLLAELYNAKHQPDSAYKYLQLSIRLKDSLFDNAKVRQFQTLSFNEEARRQQVEQQDREARQQYETKVKIYSLVTIILAIVVLAFVLYRNNKQKQKANAILQLQKEEIELTLGELKNTQEQLIHSEKMASLGELTAGIAHEIQNPLNFVNNFSEVNTELLEELKNQKAKVITGEIHQLDEELINSIIENEKKINHHGKRADSIVKGMLQHSRTSAGQKELTDINQLVDECLRLCYHGFRSKEKSINLTLQTDFDKNAGKINTIPQDLGRVLLNLFNNAFYSVIEKKKASDAATPVTPAYVPTVLVSTRLINDDFNQASKVEIRVKDNGLGVPQKVLDKIFQPFFTTKPSGQGTGLGLSLSYDIIKKGHGGELTVETEEGEFAMFVIILPAIFYVQPDNIHLS